MTKASVQSPAQILLLVRQTYAALRAYYDATPQERDRLYKRAASELFMLAGVADTLSRNDKGRESTIEVQKSLAWMEAPLSEAISKALADPDVRRPRQR